MASLLKNSRMALLHLNISRYKIVRNVMTLQQNIMFNRINDIRKKRNNYCYHMVKRNMLKHSINHILNKKVLDRYLRLPLPCCKVLATYVWIDGSGIKMRSKDRVLPCIPYCAAVTPHWIFNGRPCGMAPSNDSDTNLQPAYVYRDPFRGDPHVMILCEVFRGSDYKPAVTNHRQYCLNVMAYHMEEDPWFGLEQEYSMLDVDGWGLGWPKGGGFPAVKYQYSYCGVGAKYVVARDIVEAHTKACLYAGCDLEGTNAEKAFCSWEWQIGTAGIKAPDDLWMSRYIIARVAEDYGAEISYHAKPFGVLHPGIGLHHNVSTKSMREKGGYKFILKCIRRLEKNHKKHMCHYGRILWANKLRLCGKFRTSKFNKFSYGVANRKTSVRLQRGTDKRDEGFLEDRRPAGDCDPYLVCGMLLETMLGKAKGSCILCGRKPDPCHQY